MPFANEKLIPSGTYTIINVKHGCSITCRKDQVLRSGFNGFNWKMTQLAEKKWIIQSHSGGLSVHLGPDPEEGDKISARESKGEPHQWVIKRCTAAQDSYMIYSPKQIGLFWSLPSAEDGTAVQLARDSGTNSSWWRFRRTETAGMADGEVGLFICIFPSHDPDNWLHSCRNLTPALSPLLVPRPTRPL